jgi:hypothetical protein
MINYTFWESDFKNKNDWLTICKVFNLPNNTTCINIDVNKMITSESHVIHFNKEKNEGGSIG